jgi:hypothetical protein
MLALAIACLVAVAIDMEALLKQLMAQSTFKISQWLSD